MLWSNTTFYNGRNGIHKISTLITLQQKRSKNTKRLVSMNKNVPAARIHAVHLQVGNQQPPGNTRCSQMSLIRSSDIQTCWVSDKQAQRTHEHVTLQGKIYFTLFTSQILQPTSMPAQQLRHGACMPHMSFTTQMQQCIAKSGFCVSNCGAMPGTLCPAWLHEYVQNSAFSVIHVHVHVQSNIVCVSYSTYS